MVVERATRFELATASLEGWSSTPELRPPFIASCIDFVVGRQGFEPWKPLATDLQSAPFVHSGTSPECMTCGDNLKI